MKPKATKGRHLGPDLNLREVKEKDYFEFHSLISRSSEVCK